MQGSFTPPAAAAFVPYELSLIKSNTQAIGTGTFDLIDWTSKGGTAAACYDLTTDTFTFDRAGRWQIYGSFYTGGLTASNLYIVSLYKNSSRFFDLGVFAGSSTDFTLYANATVAALITDTWQLRLYHAAAGASFKGTDGGQQQSGAGAIWLGA